MNVNDASRLMGLRSEILSRNGALRDAAQTAGTGATDAPANAFKTALDTVTKLQDDAGSASEAFERGDMTDIAQVMIARQKAGIAFEATLQVRNKLLGAYRDIMNMPL